MDLMARYPDKYFDLAIVDPPYGIGESGKNHKSRNTLVRQRDGVTLRRCPSTNYSQKDWDNSPPSNEYFHEVLRVSQNQILFGGNYFKEFVGTPFKPPRRNKYKQFLKSYPNGWIIWDKVNGDNDFNDCELIWTSFEVPSTVIYYMWSGMMQGKSIAEGTIMQGNKSLNENRIHPTPKPVIIYKYLLNLFAHPGYKILDTNSGSGSSILAAHDLGLEIVACDNDEEYFKKSVRRIKQHVAQLTLF